MFFSDARRSKRYIALLPVIIDAVDTHGNHIAGPLSGRIIDLSRHGASLFLTRVMIEQYHICFSVQENNEHLLKISFTAGSGEKQHNGPDTESSRPSARGSGPDIILKARPVWINSYDHEDLLAFKMGVEFIEEPSRKVMNVLKKAMKEQLSSF